MGRPASFDERSNQGGGERRRHAQAHPPLDISRAGANQTQQISISAQDRRCFIVEFLPSGRRLDPTRVSLKKRNPEGSFQFRDLLAESRLRDVNGPRGLRKTARLDDSHKIIKMAVLHPPVLIGTETSFAPPMELSSYPVVLPRAGRNSLPLSEALHHAG